MRYQAGDRVIAGENKIGVREHIGQAGTVVEICEGSAYPYRVQFSPYLMLWRKVERMAKRRIVIEYAEGLPTVAKLVEDSKVIKTAESRCSPKDEYNAKTGIDLAIERLLAKSKKVFSIKALINSLPDGPDLIVHAIEVGWPQKCEGKTFDECRALYGSFFDGPRLQDAWFVETEDA